ncbi:MAG: hypothetical protein ABR577_10045 [Pyrinomonadaceae bacterium]
MDTSISPTEQAARDETRHAERHVRLEAAPDNNDAAQLDLWLRALLSFFKPRNHPFTEPEHAEALTRNWHRELRIVRQTLLKCSQLALGTINNEPSRMAAANEAETGVELDFLASAEFLAPEEGHAQNSSSVPEDLSAVALSETLADARAVCDAMLESEHVGFQAWAGLGKILEREIEHCGIARLLARRARHQRNGNVQAPLLALARAITGTESLGGDMLRIFGDLSNLLEQLRIVEKHLRRDQPLKQLLPLFTLVHEDSRALLAFIETQALRRENLDEAIFDALDGTSYAIGMELRKVFAHELVGLCALRQAPAIYAKVENAHGLLRDSFQQSTVTLAQLFDATLDGARLFNQFQTKLDQSLALRADLWTLMQLVRRGEKERDRYPVAQLLERLAEFREGSLRYLMYKDWEACERFIEEVAASRGAVELTPVLHRFGAYLETLHGQINMRAVLADHPFDYPAFDA